VARERGRRRRPHRARRLVPARGRVAAVAALAGAALGAAVTAFAMGGGEEGPAVPAARTAVPVRDAIVLHGRWGSSGRAAVVPTAAGTVLHLVVKGLPGDQDVVYEVRCESPDWSASAGTFRVDRRGHAYARLSTAARPGEYEYIQIVRRYHGHVTAVMRGKIK